MDDTQQLSSQSIEPEDLLNGARIIPVGTANTCHLNSHWIKPNTFLKWSRRGLSDGDDYGIANAVTYAKRAVCCRIDQLVSNYHLVRFQGCSYPEKIKALEATGITTPHIVHELAVKPRNQLEHDYVPVDADAARKAVDMARLLLAATDANVELTSIVALNWNVRYSQADFIGWRDHPMLFIDVFDEPHAAKIVDPAKGEIVVAELSLFSRPQAIELAKILHSHFLSSSRSQSGNPAHYYSAIKSKAGF